MNFLKTLYNWTLKKAEHKYSSWILGILNQGWMRGVRRAQSDGDKGLVAYLYQALTGIGAKENQINMGFAKFRSNEDTTTPWDWGDDKKHRLALQLREFIFPLYVAANKADIANESDLKKLIDYIEGKNSIIFPTSADSELALRRASNANLIDKARQQPEKVKMVLDKLRTDGLFTTFESIRSKLIENI